MSTEDERNWQMDRALKMSHPGAKARAREVITRGPGIVPQQPAMRPESNDSADSSTARE